MRPLSSSVRSLRHFSLSRSVRPLHSRSTHHPLIQGFGYSDPVGSGFFACFGSGSVFQISLDPEPVSTRILEQKKECRKGSKSDLSEENLKIITEDRQKMKKV